MKKDASQKMDQSSRFEIKENYIIESKDILTKKIRWDNYLKGASYLVYSLFLSLMTLSFLFSGARALSFQTIDFINIFISLFAVLFAVLVFSSIYKGALKKLFIMNFYFTHLIGGTILLITSIILAFPLFAYPVLGIPSEILVITQNRSIIFAVGLSVWFLFSIATLIFNTYKLKGAFPIPWFKVRMFMMSLLLWPILAFISLAASYQPQMSESGIFLIIQLIVIIIGFLYTSFSFVYIRTNKETLLSNKTEQEIQKIENFRNVSSFLILISSMALFVLGVTKAVNLWTSWSNSQIEILAIFSFSFDFVVLVSYLTLIFIFRKNNKNGKITKWLSSVDNSILMEFVIWLLLVKTIIIVGLSKVSIISSGVDISSTFMVLASCLIAIFIINMASIVLGIYFPNIRNTTPTIISVVASLMVLGLVIFQSTFPSDSSIDIFESADIVILNLSPLVIASSISLGIQLFNYSKIYNSNTPIINQNKDYPNTDTNNNADNEENKKSMQKNSVNEKEQKVGV